MEKQREIKFNIWDNKEKKMSKDVLCDIAEHDNWDNEISCWSVCYDAKKIYEEKRFIWLQYTGLKDKNGNEIYEGDIMEGEHMAGFNFPRMHYAKGQIVFGEYGGFVLKCKHKGNELAKDISKRYFYLSMKNIKHFEVIGNIYQDSHLLNN